MLKILNINKYISDNKLLEIHDTISFRDGKPTPTGLYSEIIFGSTKSDGFNKYAYINLGTVIIHPLIYKNLKRIKSIFLNVCLDEKHKQHKKAVIRDGYLEESENGDFGITWLSENWSKINLEHYKNGKNDKFIDKVIKSNIFIDKFLVIPTNYRQYSYERGQLNEDDITGRYKQILIYNNNSANLNAFKNSYIDAVIDISGGKTLTIQKIVNEIYDTFISMEDGKKGIYRSKVIDKRIDNITRLVANAQPNIPMDCCAIPWQNLLVMFDSFVVNILNRTSDDILDKLGVKDFGFDDFGPHFDFIFRHLDSYVEMYPHRHKLWIDILLRVFNDFPDLRVLMKRDPAWNRDSYHGLKVIIIQDVSYHCTLNSLLYKPLGGDSFSSDYIGKLVRKDNIKIFENKDIVIRGNNNVKVEITNSKDMVEKLYKGEF